MTDGRPIWDPATAIPGAGSAAEAWELLLSLLESIPVVPYLDTPDEGRTIYIGPQAEHILGVDPADPAIFTYEVSRSHVHPDDRDRTYARAFELMEAGGGSHEWRWIRPDTGEVIWVEHLLTTFQRDGLRVTTGVLIDITQQKAAEAAIAAHVEALERVNRISQAFTDVVVSSGDVTAMVDLLAELLDCSVVLTDATGTVMATAGARVTSEDATVLEREVRIRGEGWGHLELVVARAVETADLLAVDHATTAIALSLMLEREANRVQEAARSALVSDVVTRRVTSGRELARRARALGTDLGRDPLQVVVAEPVALTTQASSRERRRARLRHHLLAAADACGCPALVGVEGDRVVAVMAVPVGVTGDEIAHRFGQRGTRMGMSELVDGDDALRAYQQAVDAVEHAARRLPDGGSRSVVHFESLGLTQLLSGLAEGPELARFVDYELGALLEHDRTHGAPLLPTLAAYLGENGSKVATAKRLGVERRTVYYRLERISALLGRRLDDPEVQLRLDVALRGWEVLSAGRGDH